jgi:hypothetical protein
VYLAEPRSDHRPLPGPARITVRLRCDGCNPIAGSLAGRKPSWVRIPLPPLPDRSVG